MGASRVDRRTFLKDGSVVALAVASLRSAEDAYAQLVVPNSAGSAAPVLKAPPNACDCHHHIYDAGRFSQPSPATSPMLPNARVEEYRSLQRRIRTTRNVVVTPIAYVTDNRVTLDAISRLAPHARGVAVLHPAVTDAELKRLHDGGVRGIRFSLTNPTTAVTAIDMIEPCQSVWTHWAGMSRST